MRKKKESNDELAKVKVDIVKGSAEASIKEKLFSVVREFFPEFDFRNQLKRHAYGDLLDKITNRKPLTPDEKSLAIEIAGNAKAQQKLLRAVGIIECAIPIAVAEERDEQLLLKGAGQTQKSQKATLEEATHVFDDEFFEKFFEDATLTSHEITANIYTRIAARKVRKPNSVSLATLQTLRYLDPEVAVAFIQLCRVILQPGYVPNIGFTNYYEDDAIFGLLKVDADMVLRMIEARLLHNTEFRRGLPSNANNGSIVLFGHEIRVEFSNSLAFPFTVVEYPALRLTTAGRELASIISPPEIPSPDVIREILVWLSARGSIYRIFVDGELFITRHPDGFSISVKPES